MDDNSKTKTLDELTTEITGLKIRIKRIEHFLNSFPNAEDYIPTAAYQDDDELLKEAIKVVQRYERASASLLQRTLMVGYARAARLIDLLEEKGVIGAPDGFKPREVLKFEQDDQTDKSDDKQEQTAGSNPQASED